MIYFLIVTMLLSGLYLLWASLERLLHLEWQKAHAPPPVPEETGEDEPPELTRLGRQIEEVRLSA